MTLETIITTAVLALALINQILAIFGISPIPIEDDTIRQLITLAFTVASSVWAWWHNNSVTEAAQVADTVKDAIKLGQLTTDTIKSVVDAYTKEVDENEQLEQRQTEPEIETQQEETTDAKEQEPEFNIRLTAPNLNNEYYYSDKNPYVKKGHGLPNCTCYACGRFAELHGEFVTELGYGNAEDWFARTKDLEKGNEPRLGAIACWAKGKAARQADGAGHVSIVEAITKDGDITTSNSNYSGKLFYFRTLKKSDNYFLNDGFTFQGFIYPKIKFNVEGRRI